MRCWHGYLSGARCKWFACGPDDAKCCHPVISCFMKIQNGLTFQVLAYRGCPGKEAIEWVSVLCSLIEIQINRNRNLIYWSLGHRHIIYLGIVFSFWATVCKTVHPMLSGRCPVLSCLSVTLVYCGQTVGFIKMERGMKVGLGPRHIVLDGDPTPLPQKGTHPQFLAHICCGQMAGWIKTPLRKGHCVRCRPSSPPKRAKPLRIFGPCLL